MIGAGRFPVLVSVAHHGPFLFLACGDKLGKHCRFGRLTAGNFIKKGEDSAARQYAVYVLRVTCAGNIQMDADSAGDG